MKDLRKFCKNLFKENPCEYVGFNFLKSTIHKKFPKKDIKDKEIPKSWIKVYFKSYPRLSQIKLKNISNNKNKLFSIIQKRKSARNFQKTKLLTKTISKILYFSCGIKNINKKNIDLNKSTRMFPSAGARYPIEIYIAMFCPKEIPKGIYHYNVKKNDLELLLEGNFSSNFKKITGQKWVENSSMILIINAVFPRTIIKYKERGWRYILFEAGHIAQNICLISESLKLKSCAIGGFLDEKISKLLDINSKSELPLYLIAIGK